MKEENDKTPVGQSSDSSGTQGSGNDDKVAFASFQKALHEKKLAQEKLTSTEQELKVLREEKLQREGKNDQLLEEYRGTIKQISGELTSVKSNYAWSTLTGEIKREAMKSGCTDPDKLIKLMDDQDLKSLSENVGEDFSINKESLKGVIDKNKKDNFFLFKDSSKSMATGNPTTKKIDTNEGKSLKDLTTDEIKELYKKQGK